MNFLYKIALGSVVALSISGCYGNGPIVHNPIARAVVGGAIAGGAGVALGVLTSPYGGYYRGGYRGLPVAYGHTSYRPYYQNNYRQTGCYYRGANNPPECPQARVQPVVRINPKNVSNAELLRDYN